MKYEMAEDIQVVMRDVIERLGMCHVKTDRVVCIRSYGSKSKRILARIQGLSKIMQKAMQTKAFYAIEFISENFDKLDDDEKTKTVIHELMHIPKCFGGGFRNHRPYVTKRKVEKVFSDYKKLVHQNSRFS
ncbi:MAG: metallopeptidase [Candidatus Aenigmarchaeota archaeon]|nr:metallopeptidase [Candidatus Aenigmarchaeota archaeon]